VPPGPWLARLFKKEYLTNEKELENSENGHWDFVGNDKAPWPLSWVLFQVLRREKATRPHVGSKAEPAVHKSVTYLISIAMHTGRATADHGGPRRGTADRRTRMLLYTMLRNAESYVRCRTSAIPYDYWCVGKEERSTMGDRKEQQHGYRNMYKIPRGSPLNHGD
jgi:hypothetical protein